MKRSVIPAACLPFLFLANAHVSAQTRIALTGGFSRTSTEEFVPSVSALGEPTARPSIGLSAIVPLPRSLSLELGGAYSERGRELAYIQPCGTPLELSVEGPVGHHEAPEVQGIGEGGPSSGREPECLPS